MASDKENIVIIIQPLECLGNGDYLPIFGKAITSDLLTELSQFKQFLIKDSQIFSTSIDLQKIGDYLVQGSLTQLGEEINLNVHLTRLADGAIIWSYRNTDNITSIQQVQQELLGNLVASLQQQLDLDLLARFKKRKVIDFKAYEYWLYGMEELRKGTITSDNEARTYFAKALEIDPHYGLAYSGMSLSFFNEWSCQIWDRWELSQKGAKEWAVKALEVDAENYMANMILGKVLLFEHSFYESETYLRKALKLNSSDPFNLIQIAGAFIYLQYLEEAETLYKKSLILNPDREEKYHPTGAFIYFEKKDFKKSIKTGERFLKEGWVDFPVILAASYYFLGDLEQSKWYWQQYLNNFSSRISRDNENLENEALQWMIELNPFRYTSVFQPFWDYLMEEKNLNAPNTQENEISNANFFKQEEHIWKVRYLGKDAHLPQNKGMADIVQLMQYAGEEIKAEELLGGKIRQTSMELIDKEALLSVKKRLEEIEAALIDAIDQETDQTEALKEEYDQLSRYISSSIDKKGRIRIKGSTTDKARSAVTQRIKSALKKIESVHPELYRHLSSSIKTGNFCSYKPEKKINWDF